MKSTIQKTAVTLVHDAGEGNDRRRTFNNLNAQADNEKVVSFATVIAKLSGENVEEILVNRSELVVKDEEQA